ncbi:MAG: glycoside hydrolase family 95 protein, partial [Planctomycetota bacterium]
MKSRRVRTTITPVHVALFAGVILIVGCAMGNWQSNDNSAEDWSGLQLWYSQPAQQWTEALPVGNGRLGAMVFGRVKNETIQFNEDTLWTGIPRYYHNAEAHKYLPTIRKLLFEGKQRQAEQLAMEKFMSIPLRQEKYQPFGRVFLHFSELFPLKEECSQYQRELDLDTGVAKVSYQIAGAKFTREVFASAPDQVLVIRLTCDKPSRITFDARLETPHAKWQTLPEDKDTLILRG